ncbi:SDR family oxidoreductase [Shewanella avicenniae]|uniref:SDR family oxidoreductase n=1 Tax=Shewanella avicenniae TaxID=2814294 RepID=A0ABX7QNT8_9GAMM|nr:glucose 1-dehydrogenase [Shewanella avicenniae]QSX33136.1 SDR family oxidoreductase [Shewanella avicenniae]
MNVTYDFTGKVALVTGAASGMGFAAAKAYAQAGAAVMLSDVNETALNKAVAELSAEKGQVAGFVCNVTDEAQVADLVNHTVATFGGLDMAYNNAGIQVPAVDAADETAENFDKVNAINLRGVWACMKHELQYMREQGKGSIVNCSSVGGLVGLEKLASYHASKHGVLGMTKSAALEYAERGIRINAVCPGAINTPMVSDMIDKGVITEEFVAKKQPINRLGRPEEVANAVLWLSSDAASFVIGHALAVDGGFTIQ